MIRLGIVGCGLRVGGFVSQSLAKAAPDCRVVGIVDPDQKSALAQLTREEDKQAVFYSSLDEMVKEAKLDALLIGTRCNLHTPYAIEAAKYGLPIFLEKPVAVSMEQALALEAEYLKHPETRVLVSFPLRYTPQHVRTKEMLRNGAVGDILQINGLNYVPYGTVYFEKGYRDYEVTQGLFLQKATHDFDYLMDLAGSRITKIAATWVRGRVFGGDRPADLSCAKCPDYWTCEESPENRRRHCTSGVKEEDHLCVFSSACGNLKDGINEEASSSIFEMENGAVGNYTQVVFTRREGIRGPIISGPRGTISFDWYKGKIHHVEHHTPYIGDIDVKGGSDHFGGDFELACNFVDMIRSGAQAITPLADGLRSVYTCLAAREAAQTGKWVDVRKTEL